MRWIGLLLALVWGQETVWPGRILFELNKSYTVTNLPEELESLRVYLQGTIRERFPALRSKEPIYVLDYQANLSPMYVAKLWRRSPAILYAEPEYVPHPLAPLPSKSPLSTPQTELTYTPNDLHANNFCLSHMHVLQAWDSTHGDTTVAVAIVDTDVRFDHPDLVENIAYNWNDPINGTDDDGDGYVDNFQGWDLVGASYGGSGPFSPDNDTRRATGGHGTWVAGYAGATTNNGIGIAAPAFKCRVLPVKTAPDNQDILWAAYDGILYAAQKGAKVINCSWGGTFRSQAAQNFISQVVNTYDPLIVAAAGNVPPDTPAKFYPAQYDGVVSITAVNTADIWGGWVQIGYDIDLATTGEGITTTGLNSYFSFGATTSFASGQAAGAAALLRSWRPDLNARQAAELLRITADSVEPSNPAHLRYRLGRRINLHRAILTQDTPACRVVSWQTYDSNDSLPFAGENFYLTATYTNYLSPVANLTVSVEPLTSHLQVVQGTYGVGNLGTLQSHTQTTPFTLQVLPSCPPNARLPILFRFTGDGGYSDYQVIELSGINPAYVHLDSAQLRTTLCGNGRIGYYDTPANTQGRGALWGISTESWLFEGGLVVADDTSAHLSTRRPINGMFNHFAPTSAASHGVQGLYEVGEVNFMDAGGIGQSSPSGISGKGLAFHGRAYAPRHSPADPFVAFIYRVENLSNNTYPDLSAGWWFDFDVGNNPATDAAFVHPSLPLVYARNGAQNRFIGVVLLSEQQPILRVGRVDTFTAALNAYLGLLRSSSGATSTSGDVFSFAGFRGINLGPGAQDTIAFALVGGTTVADLVSHAQEALTWYACFIGGYSPVVNLGADRTLCLGDSLVANAPTANQYYWTYGESTPVIYPQASGVYWVLVRDTDGCWGYDEVQINLQQLSPPSISFNPGLTVSVGTPFTAAEQSSLPYSYEWSVDGQTYTGLSFTHTFTQTGTYTLWLRRTDGVCRDSLSWQITVSTSTTISAIPSSPIRLYPNPTDGTFVLEYNQLSLDSERIVLYDHTGRRVCEIPIQTSGTSYRLPEKLLPGLYLWQIGSLHGQLLYIP
ncbi:MAG: S8 family serine peptidase [Bacteroidia bacterium]|nr:S8 family serine peptidase [Bacteroidia bacterium]MDW8416018.1 S8 family serine peptidase [Bacteroidia bacterium]